MMLYEIVYDTGGKKSTATIPMSLPPSRNVRITSSGFEGCQSHTWHVSALLLLWKGVSLTTRLTTRSKSKIYLIDKQIILKSSHF